MQARRIDITATLACIGALACWAQGPIFIKFLTDYIDSWTQNLLRYAVACLFWLPFLLFTVNRQDDLLQKQRLKKKLWLMALLPAAANITMQSLWAAAFYYAGAAFVTLLSNSSAILIAAFSFTFFADERGLVGSKRFWLGLVLSVTGVIGVIYFKQDFSASGTIIGISFALGSAFAWAAYAISVRIVFRDADSRVGFSIVSVYTTAGLLVLSIIFGQVSQCLKMGAWPWLCVIISGVTAIALGHVLYYMAVKRIGTTIPSLVILAQPFLVFALSRIIFGESLNGLQLLSGLVLLFGSSLAIYAQQHLKRNS